MNLNLEHLCQQATEVVKTTASFIQSQLGKVASTDIETKSLNSLVSFVDQQAEKQLVEGLRTILPQATFLTEEETVETQKSETYWIIDPLDGTTNFLHQLPFFSISVALVHKDELVIGIVHEINRSECFYAWKNGGAWLNKKAIKVSQTTSLSDTLIATGFPYYDYERVDNYLQVLKYLMENTRGLRRFGSAALDLAYMACGRFDAFFEYSLNAWDVAGGALIVQEAGGKIYDFSGGDNYLFGKEILATTIPIERKLLSLLKKVSR